jgi:hypothetical protein
MMEGYGFPYVWAWRQSAHRAFDRCRKGERCRVVCRGTMNSALVEFEDGYRVVTSRNGIRLASTVRDVRT